MSLNLFADLLYCFAMLVLLGVIVFVFRLYTKSKEEQRPVHLLEVFYTTPGRLITVLTIEFFGGIFWGILLASVGLRASAVMAMLVGLITVLITTIGYFETREE